MDIALWVLAFALIGIGLLGTVLPALPGPPLVLLGVLLAAWIDGFARIPGYVCAIVSALALVAMAIDWIAGAMGAQKMGASKWAIIGATIGAILGVLSGFLGLLFMPLAGAALGEFLARQDLLRAGQVGLATWLGMLIGTVVKLAIVAVMIGIFAGALLLSKAPA
ncbi:MAG: DUF456 domain-containing protein [Betaproteobacteria bacterium]